VKGHKNTPFLSYKTCFLATSGKGREEEEEEKTMK